MAKAKVAKLLDKGAHGQQMQTKVEFNICHTLNSDPKQSCVLPWSKGNCGSVTGGKLGKIFTPGAQWGRSTVKLGIRQSD